MNLTQTVTWIPVEERLPEHGKSVALAFHNNGVANGCLDDGRYHKRGGKRWNTSYRVAKFEEVTHWALPLTHPAQLQAEGEK